MLSGLLQSISGPEDLKNLTPVQMEQLAEEIRREIISVVSRTGGHLGASLGTVELSLALHSVFDSPRDKIIWDVGHQSYCHKIITGRRDQFATLRQYGGLSGFPKRSESPHDCFETGHSSTSISAALGFAKARDMKGERYSVVAVIGDGSMTGGQAFEGLNNAGKEKTDLIVILNDNSMSISPNVGAIAEYLSRIRSDPRYSRVKADVKTALRRIPSVGGFVWRWLERLKGSVKYLFIPGTLFEEMGFTYLGPINGHNIETMRAVFQRAKTMKGPILIHVLTTKGKGYPFAEENPDEFHGPGPFMVETGEPIKRHSAPSYSDVFGNALVEIAAEDKSIVAITAAMRSGTGLAEFAQRFPERFYDVGIAEQHAVTFAAGLAAAGLRPVVAIYSTFLQRAYDQICHDVARQNLPVVFCVDRAGIVGEDGETHQGIFDIAYLRHIPGMVVMAPADEVELRDMLYTAVNHQGPVAIRYPRGRGTGKRAQGGFRCLPMGRGEVIVEGTDVSILAYGTMVNPSVEAAETLREEGISVSVFNARFAVPLDEETVVSLAQKTGRVVTVEEGIVSGGFGSAVLEALSRKGICGVAVRCLGIPGEFVAHGPREVFLKKYGLTSDGIAQSVREMLRNG